MNMIGKTFGKIIGELVAAPVTIASESVKAADEAVKQAEKAVERASETDE